MHNNDYHAKSASLYRTMLMWQLLATLVVALISRVLGGQAAAVSALIGGMSVILGAWFAGKVALNGYQKQQAGAILINLLKAEAVKILVIAVALFFAFKLYRGLVPFALIAGLVASALFSGVALAKSETPV